MSNEQEIEGILANEEYQRLKEVKDSYAIAGVIKKIFDKMPLPIIPSTFYNHAIKEKRGIMNSEEFKQKIEKIPKLNYRTLAMITSFLTRVAQFKEDNKMPAYNLAVVFAPSFLRPEVYTMDDYKEYLNFIL